MGICSILEYSELDFLVTFKPRWFPQYKQHRNIIHFIYNSKIWFGSIGVKRNSKAIYIYKYNFFKKKKKKHICPAISHSP